MKIPNNKGSYVQEKLLEKLFSYEQAKELFEKGFDERTEYYWYDNSAWNKNEPVGLMTYEDAHDRQSKGIAFIDFDTTIPAPSINEYNQNK